ncbi:hypothetical protein TI39_contig742g00012 [Zymoseptoria brevis]|uniref:Uncharacterized protein n=1 Tax=Zymoseptoria brevis TaxID=1047168 RepID=A0A0F4GFZ7_9PEZI|nr:hypothetical protein TI39_contig742g00012 [Zymoseptoria brevis]
MFKTGERQNRIRRFAQRTPPAGTRSEPPLVTYGKRTKPLQIQGTHFLHSEPQPVPKDVRPEVFRGRPHEKRSVPEPGPDDPPLSEDELEAVYNGGNASPIEEYSNRPEIHHQPSRMKPLQRGRETKQAGEPSCKSPPLQDQKHAATNDIAQHPRDISQRPTVALHVSPTQSQHMDELPPNPTSHSGTVAKHPRSKPDRPRRHLPVDELILVASPPSPIQQNEFEQGADTEIVRVPDPIADTSSPAHGRTHRPDDDKEQLQEAPLTLHRKRLRTPKFTHKSIVELRKKRRTETPRLDSKSDRIIGDGFSSTEIKTGRGSKVKSRKVRKTLTHVLEALQLEAGPLPEVEFQDSSCELKMEEDLDEETKCAVADQHHDDDPFGPCNGVDERKVTFSDRVFDQLSSISAPRRVYSISSDDSDDEQDLDDSELEEEEECQNEETESRPDESEVEMQPTFRPAGLPVPVRTPRAVGTPVINHGAQSTRSSDRHLEPIMRSIEKSAKPLRVSGGVTLDFRHVITPGTGPIQVPMNKRRLMEVNDMIVDEAFVEQQEQSDLPSDPYLLKGFGPPPDQQDSTRRPRSILRNHTPNTGDGTTGREFTSANTRRNSIVTTEDSDYFSTATGMLNHRSIQPRTTSRRVVTQLAHDTAALDYFARKRREVHVVDSESVIPETSPERRPMDYITNLGTQMLRRAQENPMSSSEALPGVPKNLKTLTRTVSRDNGTLSQAVRRRPSLPFQSPIKVRR